MPLAAEIEEFPSTDRRGAVRRKLRLRVDGQLSRHAVEAVIRDLSEGGVLLETPADLTVGERLHVELPEAGMRAAIVVWNRGHFFGCEFKIPLPKKIVSATLLLSPSERSSVGLADLERLAAELESDRAREAEADRGALLVLIISLAVLVLIALLFLNALFASPTR